MRPHKRPRNLLASGILLVGLVGVLIFNLVIMIDLPSRVYTAKQRAYLDYNRSRSISQAAPTWNIITAEGIDHILLVRAVEDIVALRRAFDGVTRVGVYPRGRQENALLQRLDGEGGTRWAFLLGRNGGS